MKRIAAILIGLTPWTVVAQDSLLLKKPAREYYFQFQSAALVGDNSGKLITHSIGITNGLVLGRRWRVGAGAELNSYLQWNILPVMASVSYDLLGKKNKVFVRYDYGKGLAAWGHYFDDMYAYKKSKAGDLYGFAIGYRAHYHQMTYSFGLGRKSQHVTTYYEYPTYYWRFGNYVQGEPSRKTVENTLNRFMLFFTIGWK
jgi:hypothetical protein